MEVYHFSKEHLAAAPSHDVGPTERVVAAQLHIAHRARIFELMSLWPAIRPDVPVLGVGAGDYEARSSTEHPPSVGQRTGGCGCRNWRCVRLDLSHHGAYLLLVALETVRSCTLNATIEFHRRAVTPGYSSSCVRSIRWHCYR